MTEPGSKVQAADAEMADADAAEDVVVVDEGPSAGDTAEGEAPVEQPAEADAAPPEPKMVLFNVHLHARVFISAESSAVQRADSVVALLAQVPPEVKADLMEQMIDMGFSKERSLRAVRLPDGVFLSKLRDSISCFLHLLDSWRCWSS